jgi:integrase
MAKLTQAAVDRVRKPAERLELSDGLVPGLYLIVQPSGSKSWAIRYRDPQNRTTAKFTLGSAAALDLKAARTLARQELARIAGGEDPRARRRREASGTLGAVIEQYKRHVVAGRRPRTQIEVNRHLDKDWQPLHPRPLAELSRREIAARLLVLKDEKGPVAANRARASLSALFTWAIKQGLADVNPVAGTGKVEERPRERVLSLDELREVWRATEGPGSYNAAVRLLLLLGQRKGEIGALMWSELALDKALWSIPSSKTKNARAHAVPLSTQAAEILEAQPKLGAYVFGADGSGPFSGWSRCKRRLDARILAARREVDPQAKAMLPWTLHDLRRSLATHVAEQGIAPPHVIEMLLNHVSGHKSGVAGVYDRSTHAVEKARAVQAWADHVLEVDAANVAQFQRKSA